MREKDRTWLYSLSSDSLEESFNLKSFANEKKREPIGLLSVAAPRRPSVQRIDTKATIVRDIIARRNDRLQLFLVA